MIATDLDGDGNPDLAVTNSRSDTVSILLGDGLGGFSVIQEIGVGEEPSSIAVGEFNGDGAADLAVTNWDDSTVSILLGDGLGGFSVEPEPIRVGTDPVSVAVGEFDGDGVADLAVVSKARDSVSILLGDGLGGFSETPEIDVGDFPAFVVVGEFNGDGLADLVVANEGSHTVSVLLGDGSGEFMSNRTFSAGGGPASIAVGEFNGDGVVDLAVANFSGDSVSILLGDGSGEFTSSVTIGVGNAPGRVAAGEFNGDGAADLVVANRADDSLSILLGDGLGGFSSTPEVGVGSFPRAVAVGEFNGDGAGDLVVANRGDDSVSILLGDGLGGLSSTPEIVVGSSPESVAVGEFNGDGIADLAFANSVSPGSVGIWLGDGLGGFTSTSETGVGNYPRSVTVAEFNGDGAADLIVTNYNDHSVNILLGDGAGGIASSSEFDVGTFPNGAAVADFNGDGAADLVVSNFGTFNDPSPDTLSILLGDGQGGLTSMPEIGVGDRPLSIATGDFNSDGASDLAVTTLNDLVSILLSDGQGGFSIDAEIGVEGASFVAAGEFNGDGVTDLAVSGSSPLRILLGDGRGGFSMAPETSVGTGFWSIAVGEFNGDGIADLVGANVDNSSVGVVVGDGMGGFSAALELGVGESPLSVAVGEFNGDGAVDLAVANFVDNSATILFNQLSDRADLNGSNRIDGFDVAAIGRLAGRGSGEPGYRRGADVDLNGTIDGADLALVASRFGELRKEVSPLRAALENSLEPDPSTITLQQVASEGDLLTVAVLVNDEDDPVAAADFAVTFEPTDEQSDEVLGQVLEVAGFEPGSYLAGGVGQVYTVNTDTPGRVDVGVSRLPVGAQVGSGEQSLINLFFRARREGAAEFDFAAFRRNQPTLLDAADQEVAAVNFVGGVDVSVVTAEDGGTPGQKIGFAPELLDFGQVDLGATVRKTLRISNFGFSELTVVDVGSTLPAEFASFFTSSFTVPPFGFVELTVEFSPERIGLFSGDIVIESDDPQRPDTDGDGFGEIRAPLLGRSGLDLAVVPTRVDFGRVTVGNETIRSVQFKNRGSTPLTLTSFQSSDSRFVPQAGFSILDPGETGSFGIRFLPDVSGELRGVLTIGLDAPAEKTVVVSLVGTGETDGDVPGKS